MANIRRKGDEITLPFNTRVRRSEVEMLISKERITDYNKHELYILSLALMNELANMGNQMRVREIIRLNADCIITEYRTVTA